LASRGFRRLAPWRGAWWREAEVGVVGQFGGTLARSLGKVALSQRLPTPGDAFDKPGLVAGADGFAENVGVAKAELRGAQALQLSQFAVDVAGHEVFLW